MSGINKVILIGNLGKDPETRYMQDGKAVTNFTIATSEEWKDKNSGEKKEKTEWHSIVAWGKLGEICGEYLSKGKMVYIEGKLQTRYWEDDDGKKFQKTEINAMSVQFLSGPDSNPKKSSGAGAPGKTGSNVPDDDDIPF